jgi:Uma2 family endonuclease
MAMTSSALRATVLTAEEYDALPPNSRVELVDGVLHAMTPLTARHQIVVDLLLAALREGCPDDLRVLREQEIRLADDHRRNPDLVVVAASAFDLDRHSYAPSQTLLAVEVTSPGTETIDRLHKPIEYARAGIEHFWRVELKPTVVVHTYRLGETGSYLETGLFGPEDVTVVPGLPWAKIEVSSISPGAGGAST